LLLITDLLIIKDIKRSSIINEATLAKSNSNNEKLNQLWQGMKELKETMLKLTNVQKDKLDKLTNITQNLENKLNGIQQRMVEYENKLDQLQEEKEQRQDGSENKSACLST